MKHWWQRWTYEIPLRVSDALWDVLVVQFAAWLDRLTLRRIIAFIPVLILILAYYHSIPLPPELMLVGDVLAYIDVFSVILLLGVLSRAATILFIIRQAAERAIELAANIRVGLDRRHRRESRVRRGKAASNPANKDDDEHADGSAGAIVGVYRLKPEGHRFGIRATTLATAPGRLVLAFGRRHTLICALAARGPGCAILA